MCYLSLYLHTSPLPLYCTRVCVNKLCYCPPPYPPTLSSFYTTVTVYPRHLFLGKHNEFFLLLAIIAGGGIQYTVTARQYLEKLRFFFMHIVYFMHGAGIIIRRTVMMCYSSPKKSTHYSRTYSFFFPFLVCYFREDLSVWLYI